MGGKIQRNLNDLLFEILLNQPKPFNLISVGNVLMARSHIRGWGKHHQRVVPPMIS